jgi:WD40 repeat protein
LIAFSPDGSRLAVASDDDTATIHDIGGDDRAVPLVSRGHGPLALAFSPDGRWVASGGKDCVVKVWDAQTGKLLQTFKSHINKVTRLIFFQRPDGLWLASGSRDSTVKLWNLHRLNEVMILAKRWSEMRMRIRRRNVLDRSGQPRHEFSNGLIFFRYSRQKILH